MQRELADHQVHHLRVVHRPGYSGARLQYAVRRTPAARASGRYPQLAFPGERFDLGPGFLLDGIATRLPPARRAIDRGGGHAG